MESGAFEGGEVEGEGGGIWMVTSLAALVVEEIMLGRTAERKGVWGRATLGRDVT
jgi:hypothetical protein